MTAHQPDLFSTAVQPLFEEHRGDWLAEARAVARHLAGVRGEITIDDVREVCPPPAGVDPRVCGAVFRTDEFEGGGYVNSSRSVNHHRPVRLFHLRGSK